MFVYKLVVNGESKSPVFALKPPTKVVALDKTLCTKAVVARVLSLLFGAEVAVSA